MRKKKVLSLFLAIVMVFSATIVPRDFGPWSAAGDDNGHR